MPNLETAPVPDRIPAPIVSPAIVDFTIDALLVAVLIAQLLQLYPARLWSWLEWRSIRYLGAISYPIYLYHQSGFALVTDFPEGI